MELSYVKNSEKLIPGIVYSRKYRLSKNLLVNVIFDLRFENIGVGIELYEIVSIKDSRFHLITSDSLVLEDAGKNLKKSMDDFLAGEMFKDKLEKMVYYAKNEFPGFIKWKYNKKKKVWEKLYIVDKTQKKKVAVPMN